MPSARPPCRAYQARVTRAIHGHHAEHHRAQRCAGGVWHVPSTGPPCSVWDRGRRVRACVPPRGQLTGLEGAVAMRALPRAEGWAVVCFLRRSVSLDTPKRYYMPSISDREGGWGREVEGVECSVFVARALGVIYPTPALQMLLLGDSRPGTRRTLPRGCRYAGRETNTDNTCRNRGDNNWEGKYGVGRPTTWQAIIDRFHGLQSNNG